VEICRYLSSIGRIHSSVIGRIHSSVQVGSAHSIWIFTIVNGVDTNIIKNGMTPKYMVPVKNHHLPNE
jgi:hypothetical protein